MMGALFVTTNEVRAQVIPTSVTLSQPDKISGTTTATISLVDYDPVTELWSVQIEMTEDTGQTFYGLTGPGLPPTGPGFDYGQNAQWEGPEGEGALISVGTSFQFPPGIFKNTVQYYSGYTGTFYVQNGGGFQSASFSTPPSYAELTGGFQIADSLQAQDSYRLNHPPISNPGGSIQLSTGAESTSRRLFSFHGARDWGLALHYNSILASQQVVQGQFGFGWTHDFEANIKLGLGRDQNGVTYSVITVNWDASRSNTYIALDNINYICTEDGARFDSIHYDRQRGWILVRKDQSSLVFSSTGQLMQDIDPNGRVLNLSYTNVVNGVGQLASITEPISNTSLSFTYDGSGTVSSVVDSVGASMSFTYAQSNGLNGPMRVLSSIKNQNGFTVNYTYLAKAQILKEIDNAGNILTQNSYDQYGDINFQMEGNGYEYSVVRNSTGGIPPNNQVTVTVGDRDGNYRTSVFDGNFNLLKSVGVGAGSQSEQDFTYGGYNEMLSGGYVGQISHYTYDSIGNLLTSTDPLGNTTQFSYDESNNLLTMTDASGAVTTFTYDSNNNLLSTTDPLGNTTKWTYDSNSLPVTKTLPGGGVFQYVYTAGRLTQSTDPNGIVQNFTYDADGRLLSRQDALGNATQYTYDGIGNVVTTTNALGQTFTFTYDYRNRIATRADPSGAVTSYSYDLDSNLLTVTDALGNVTTCIYDPEDRLIEKDDPLRRAETFAYNAAGRLSTRTEPGGNTTTYHYDAANRLSSWVDGLNQSHSFTYDSRGLLLTSADPLGRITSRGYDSVGRLTTVTDPLSRTTQYAYDAIRRLTQVTDPGGLVASQGYDANSDRTSFTDPASNSTTIGFDAGGRITSETTPLGNATTYAYDTQRGLLNSVTLPSGSSTTFTYDAAGRTSSLMDSVGSQSYTRDSLGRILTVTENGKTLTRVYDALGRLTSYTDGVGNVMGYQYDGIGRLTALIYPNGSKVTYGYSPAGNLSTVTDWAGRVTSYSYDILNRLTGISRPNGTTQTRTYDAASQLLQIAELAPDGVTVIFSGNYGFDAAGQITNETTVPVAPPPIANSTQTYDADNRLLSHNGAATTFDANGNLLAVAQGFSPATFSYDARNRLSAAGALSYTYDAENRRVALTDPTGTTVYAVNPNAPLDQVLVRTTPDGTQTYYVYGLGLLYEQTGASVSYYHSNFRGDTVALSDSSGKVTDTVAYDVFGAVVSRTGTSSTPFLFNGLYGVQTDSNGLYYHRSRYYSPILRRFLNQDTILGEISVPQSLNRFAYVNGNPISFIDPFGTIQTDPAPNSAEDKSLNQGGVQPVYGANGKQIGSVTVVTYVATAHGLKIVLGYTDAGSGLSNFNWVQTIRTNQPLGGATSPYNDPQPPDDNLPFYWTNAELPSYTNTNGYNVIFIDGPQRPGNATWQGELSVVGMNGQGGYQALQTFTYGFDINNGKVTLQPLQPSSPSAFQSKSIPGPP